jgi:hypothetical protein
MANYRTPGVYVEEIQTLPPSVAEVSTAVPAFIGYTKIGPDSRSEPVIKRISSMLEFMTHFGSAFSAKFSVTQLSGSTTLAVNGPVNPHKFSLYYALSHYFKNGGGPCYVVSVGNYQATPNAADFSKGIQALEQEDEPTLLVLTDAACLLSAGDYYRVCSEALAQCKKLGDRFTILDVVTAPSSAGKKDWEIFRDEASLSANLDYGAAYTPYLQTSLNYLYSEDDVEIAGSSSKTSTPIWSKDFANDLSVKYSGSLGAPEVKIVNLTASDPITFEKDTTGEKLIIKGVATKTAQAVADAWAALSDAEKQNLPVGYSVTAAGTGLVTHTDNQFVGLVSSQTTSSTVTTMASLIGSETGQYNQIKSLLGEQRIVLPPSAAMAGIYARVDREQGVWKAPANAGVMAVLGPVAKITDAQQEQLNIDPTAGKSINAIRAFTGKGTLVWGARTLAGNDNEWRYVSVRRLFITIEESTRKASAFAVFEANNQSTWLKVKAMIESYLYGLWQQGALAGSTAEAAYYVNVGLGTTMTPQDVLEGKMIVEVGIAAVRPAEFIVLRFSHKLQTA